MKVLARLRAWWRGPAVEPEVRTEAKQIQEDRTTRRIGHARDQVDVISHGGKESVRGLDPKD
jgi:hypothetical protein